MLHFSLCKGVAGLAEFRLETHSPHELLIVLLPKGMPILVPPDDHTFHVVREDILRYALVPEPVEHTNKQVFLRRNQITGRRNKVLVSSDIVFHNGLPAVETICTEPAEAHSGVCHSGLQKPIQDTRVAARKRSACSPAFAACSDLESVLLHPAQSGTRNLGTVLQLCKVDFLQRELVPLFSHYLLNSLRHSWGHGCKIGLLHLVSFQWGLMTPSV